MSVLIVGGDSLIGSMLKEACLRRLLPVYVTSRKFAQTRNTIYLDLFEHPSRWQLPSNVRVAVFCAAATKISDCESDPIRTRRVNVEAPASLASRLQESGAAVIFLSTDLVFGGYTFAAKWSDPLNPRTVYGHQKAEAEMLITKSGPNVAILRLTKVVHPSLPLFIQWATCLRRGLVIRPFSNRVFSPLPASFVVEAILGMVAAFTPGRFQLSGDRNISYWAAALLLAKCLNVSEALIQPCRSENSEATMPMPYSILTPHLPPGYASEPCPSVEETLTEVYSHYEVSDVYGVTTRDATAPIKMLRE